MRITVKARARARVEKVEKVTESEWKVYVRTAPEKGKANKKICQLLARYCDVKEKDVHVVSGHTSKTKIVEIQQ